ncbi:Pre-mRNA-splicing factor cwf16 [Colletotrichum siamense]|uniref:Splicing factor YJU2 n=1 Tax=Colletotrichum siamense TaxID=690259 RepID=A0A9P5ERL8_COLSI|nr:Pre-mRNA-splicing factor cwf16 [Colletotrichum siamense]KAF4858237.1 Pre-mRNA-splicing factor cwf16 [Colletotrichum siamense]
MSERKVVSKYYPPTFDPSQLLPVRHRGKAAAPEGQQVRWAAPFSMQCTLCGEYIGKGRKFNARKLTLDENYLDAIQIYRLFIRCTRCSREITLRTVPQASDYVCETGAKRITEPWRIGDDMANETADERLDRLEREHEKRENTEKTTMEDIEKEALATQTHMAVADALDEVRARNVRLERLRRDGITVDKNAAMTVEDQKDEEHTRRAFSSHARAEAEVSDQIEAHIARHTDINALVKTKRYPQQTKLLPGLKQAQAKAPPATPSLVDYGSDSE